MNGYARRMMLLAGLTAASNACGCEPGHYDGIWETIGVEAPPADVVLDELAGAGSAIADKLLRKPPDVSMRGSRYWVFELRREAVYRTCTEPDDVTYAQNFLVVRATMRNGVVGDCDVQFRNVHGSEPVGVQQLLATPSGPQDDPLHTCAIRESTKPSP